MRVNYRWLGLAAFVAATAAVGACGGTETTTFKSPCKDINCGDNPFVVCDDFDALCKCGPAELNLICGTSQVCTQQGTNQYSCVASKCEHVQCDAGETCDPLSGACKCGTGPSAKECEATQTCENGRCTPDICDTVKCDLGYSCDPKDGSCKCGNGTCDAGVVCFEGKCDPTLHPCEVYPPECQPGEGCDETTGLCKCGAGACEADQRCENNACVADPCSGVNCPLGTSCNAADAQCHCGTGTGPICQAGQACAATGECVENTVCKNVTCAPGMVCDPNPEPGQGGFCRCGGIGAAFPRCAVDQTCDLEGAFPACRGGDPCKDVDCKDYPGASCDPEDGFCKCGGLDGVRCTLGEACAVEEGENVCATLCDPLGKDCTGEEGCYYDVSKKTALCLTAGDTGPDKSCNVSADCVPGSFCAQSGDAHICREICNTDPAPDEPNGCPESKSCSPMPSRLPKFPKLGQCISL